MKEKEDEILPPATLNIQNSSRYKEQCSKFRNYQKPFSSIKFQLCITFGWNMFFMTGNHMHSIRITNKNLDVLTFVKNLFFLKLRFYPPEHFYHPCTCMNDTFQFILLVWSSRTRSTLGPFAKILSKIE